MFFICMIGQITAVIIFSSEAKSRPNVDHVSKTHHSILPFLILKEEIDIPQEAHECVLKIACLLLLVL